MRRNGRMVRLLVVAVVIAVAGGYAVAVLLPADKADESVAVKPVARGPLVIDVSISGTIQNRDLVKVKNEVEGRTSILSLVDEGTHVKKDQLLVELDSSGLVESLEQQEITVLKADASLIQAQQDLEVTKSQAKSDVDRAKLDFDFAGMDLEKYEKGDYPQALQKAENDITLAQVTLLQAEDKLKYSRTLAEQGFITKTELQGDELDKQRAELNLKLSETNLKLLKEYTYNKSIAELKSNVEQTEAALDRVKRKAEADVIQAEATLKSRDSEYKQQKARYEKLKQQITKCRITAPVAGMVVYASTANAGRRGQTDPLAEGQEIRERQELIFLPVSTSMMAEVKIHESALRKVKVGMSARLTVDAVPGKVFMGKVGKIGLLPDAQSFWMNPDLKVYNTEIYIDGDAVELRAGMGCSVQIIVATYDDALYVPIQSVMRVEGQPTVYVLTPTGAEPRKVEIGLDNNVMIRIINGLTAGEEVLLAPPLGPSSVPISQGIVPEDEKNSTAPEPVPTPAPGQTGAADNTTQAAPGEGAQAVPQPAFDPAKLRDMTPEERRKAFESLTPEQREQMRQQGGGRRRTGQRGQGGQGDGEGGGQSGGQRSGPRQPRPEDGGQ